MPHRPAVRAPGGSSLPASAAARAGRRWPLSRRWTVLLVLLALVFVSLRVVHALAPAPVVAPVSTGRVVVVGVPGRYQLTDTDRTVLGPRLAEAQAGAMSVRPRYVGDCAAAGWATLGAGRRAGVEGRCGPEVQGSRVVDWVGWQAAAAAQQGDARLGTLAELATSCVAAVGPGAALAAARPDGSIPGYQSAPAYLDQGARTRCPITLVDGGADADRIIAAVARQPDVTLLVTGIGPAAGSADPGLQVVYRVGASQPGWLTSGSTRREGVVTLADVTRTLIEFGRSRSGADGTAYAAAVDGAPLQVDAAPLTLPGIEHHLRSLAALSDAALTGYLILGVGGSLLFVLLVLGLVLGRLAAPRLVFAFGCVLGAVMLLAGSVPWWRTGHPGTVVGVTLLAWGVVLTALALRLARLLAVPVAVAGAALTFTVFTLDAGLGGVLQPGSLLNSRPVVGGRWYGFGNVTFSVYATAGLVLAGYVAHRLRRSGHHAAGLVGAVVVGAVVVVCEGWPTMGTDFGGVLSLTPGLLWMLFLLSGVRLTWPRALALGGGAMLAVGLISYLDWRRGPDARSHLGNFVQRILDGDAIDIVSRKGVTALETVASVGGVLAVVLGAALWWAVFRGIVPLYAGATTPADERGFSTLQPVAVAVLATAVLGTLLNDGGVYVWLTVTASFLVIVGSLWVDRSLAAGRLAWTRNASR